MIILITYDYNDDIYMIIINYIDYMFATDNRMWILTLCSLCTKPGQ